MDENPAPQRRIRIMPTLVVVMVALALGIWAARVVLTGGNQQRDELSATRFPVARPLQPFRLVDQHGESFDNARLHNHWSLLFFGYTHCPDVCPTTLSVLNGVAQRMTDSAPPVQYVFITVDPKRDTAEQLAGFVRYFNPQFVGVTGSEQQIDALAGQLGVLHEQVPNQANPSDYLVDHSASVFVIDPDGNYHGVLTPPLSVEAIAADLTSMARDFH